jgi:DNA-binding response OmpR family regulator
LHHPGIEQADYFIIDYMLGGSLNGIQFLNRVRQKLGRPIHAVLMTGDTSAAFIREAANCDWPALHKPVNLLRLKSALSAQASTSDLA